MATVANDVMRVYFDVIVNDGLQKLALVQKSFTQLQSILSKFSQFRAIGRDLASVGLAANSAGKYIDVLTGQYVSLADVSNRFNQQNIKQEQSRAASSFRLSDVGISQATTKKTYSAQELLNQAISEGANEAQRYSSSMTQAELAAKSTTKTMNIFQDQARSIGILMGLIFGGMMFRRVGQSILRFVLPAMDQLAGYTSDGTKKINAMNASFQFLKFNMFEAFTSTSLFRGFVDLLINAANWISKFVSQHPGVTIIAASLGAIFITLGSIAGLFGGAFQTGMLWYALFGSKTAAASVGGISSTNKVLSLLKSPITWLILAMVVLTTTIMKGYKEFPELKEQGKKAFEAIGEAAGNTLKTILGIVNIDVDTSSGIYLITSIFNLALLGAAKLSAFVSFMFQGFVNWVKIFALEASNGLLKIAGTFESLIGKKDKAMLTQGLVDSGDALIDELLGENSDAKTKFDNTYLELDKEIDVAVEGITNGRDAALKLAESYELTSTKVADLTGVTDINTVANDNLITSTKELISQSSGILEAIDKETEAYLRLADAKSKVRSADKGDSLGSVRGTEMVSDGNGGFIQKKYARS